MTVDFYIIAGDDFNSKVRILWTFFLSFELRVAILKIFVVMNNAIN